MKWTTGYRNFVNEVTKAGGTNAFCKKYSLSEKIIVDYIKKIRTPNYMSRIALAALVGLPLHSFD